MGQVINLIVSESEIELLNYLGKVYRLKDGAVDFKLHRYLEFHRLVKHLEDAILRQEMDSGDWLRAKEWRLAKPGLLEKLRAKHLKLA